MGASEAVVGRLFAMATLLASGESLTEQVNPANWKWYELLLEDNGTHYNALVTVDSETLIQSAGEQVWAQFDVLLVNGTLPGNAQTEEPGPVGIGSPYCWITEECTEAYALQFVDVPRATISFGYNYTAPSGLMPPLSNVIIGVRATSFGVTSFTVSATRLPRVLTDGDVIDSALAPCADDDEATCRQYFTVPVRGYDILELRLVRTGDNLTITDDAGALVSNGGRGLVGNLYVGGPETEGTPPPAAYVNVRSIGNLTEEVVIDDYFCTMDAQAGTYTVAVIAGNLGGFGPELLTTAAEREINSGVARQGRGRYRLEVRHAIFEAGEIGEIGGGGDVRQGCVDYGQTRNYTVRASGIGDANLYVSLSGANVTALRARCSGCDWLSAEPPISALSASPCTMRNGTTWEVQVTLAQRIPAILAGIDQP